MITTLGIIRISPCSPRVTITVAWGCDVPLGSIGLYMKRAGSPTEFAIYPPLSIDGSKLLFEFDELLWVQPQGRFIGRLVVGDREFSKIQFEYRDEPKVIAVEKS